MSAFKTKFFILFSFLMGWWMLAPALQAQENKRSEELLYIDQLFNKTLRSLKRFVKTYEFDETVVLTSLFSINADISVSEKNYLINKLERIRFKKRDFAVITSVKAFNQTQLSESKFSLDFESEKEQSETYGKELESDYYMHITLDFKRRTIGMEMAIFTTEDSRKIWGDKVSIFFDGTSFNYELGILQSVGYNYAVYISNLINIDLTSIFAIGIYLSLGYAFLNTNETPDNIGKFAYIAGLRLSFSLSNAVVKVYKDFELFLILKLGINGGIPLSGTVESSTFSNPILATLGLNFLITGNVSISLELDAASLIIGLIQAGPVQSSLLGFVEIAYHF